MRKKKFVYLFAALAAVFMPLLQFAQLNGFAKVTAINGRTLTLGNSNTTSATFVPGQQVILIQMQGAAISNNANAAGFGLLSNLNSAGLYETGIITAVNGALSSMTLAWSPSNTYSTSGNVQVVTYPLLGSPHYSTTADITSIPWNGTIGGVTAFRVNGNIFMFHSISAVGAGFRGGARAQNDGGACETVTFRTSTGNNKYADKGEGVYITASGEKSGRAKAVNGGGGGIVHNGGGGGGGNFTGGGNGYYGYTGSGYCNATTHAGGQGGLAVPSNTGRIFMGGGGGGAQGNNTSASGGGAGGGLVLISCDTIVLRGICGTHSIGANGAAAANSSGNDGAGGGGAGGTVLLDIKGISVSNTCSLTISANGGDGGNVADNNSHGSGGGGGQGALYIKANGPFARTTLQTNNGLGGKANNGASPPTAGNGAGANGAGISTGSSGFVLPVTLVAFQGIFRSGSLVDLTWQTMSETANERFDVLRSRDGVEWKKLGSVAGNGTTSSRHFYSFTDRNAAPGLNYYKLRQTDTDGNTADSEIVYLVTMNVSEVSLFPNPAGNIVTLRSLSPLPEHGYILIDALGYAVSITAARLAPNELAFSVRNFAPGVYTLHCAHFTRRLIIE